MKTSGLSAIVATVLVILLVIAGVMVYPRGLSAEEVWEIYCAQGGSC